MKTVVDRLSQASEPAIQLRDLTKVFSGSAVVKGLNLEIPKGSIFGFLGPNGAGKTTTIRMIAGLTTPDHGDVWLLGKSVRTEAVAVKQMIGVVPDDMALFDYMTVGEHLDLIRSMYGVKDEIYQHRVVQLLELFRLLDDMGKLARDCSFGMKKKLSLAMALLPNPKILILDEPLEGLDPVMCVTIKQALKRAAAQGTTIFLTTHMLHSVNDLIEQFGILREGSLVAEGSVSALAQKGLTLEDAYLREFDLSENRVLEWLG